MLIYEKDNLGRSFLQIVFLNSGSIFFKDGVANFAKEMLNRGTKTKKEKIFSDFEENAISVNFSLTHEYFTLSLKCLNPKRKKAVELLTELFTNLDLSEEAFEKTKKEVISKKEFLKTSNDYIAHKNLFKAIFENTPLAYHITGENIENITLQDIKNYFENLTQNVIVINGGEKFNYEKFIKFFAKKEKEKYPYYSPQHKNIKETKPLEQSYIYFANELKTNQHHLAKVATFILGSGGFGSRIMEEIRVKNGYAYSAYAFNLFKKSHNILMGYMQTKIENTEDAIKKVEDILNDFSHNGVTEKELKSAKQFLLGSEPLRNETLTQRLFRKFNDCYLDLGENYYQKELNLIENTDLDELNEFIKQTYNPNLSFSILTNG